MESCIIRKADNADSASLAKIQVDNYRASYTAFYPRDYFDHFTYEEQTRDWKDLFQDQGNKVLLIAETAEHEPAGYILLEANPELYPGYDAEIIALHVLDRFRKTGIGKTLLQEGISQLLQKNCKSVMLWTLEKNPVRSWYDALCGTVIDSKCDDMDDWEVCEVAYGWESITTLQQSIRYRK